MAKTTIAKQVEDNKSSTYDKQKALELALANIRYAPRSKGHIEC